MLELRPIRENCGRPLSVDSAEAMICSFECTFCKTCGAVAYQVVLENASGYISLKFTSEGVEEIQQLKKSG